MQRALLTNEDGTGVAPPWRWMWRALQAATRKLTIKVGARPPCGAPMVAGTSAAAESGLQQRGLSKRLLRGGLVPTLLGQCTQRTPGAALQRWIV